MSEIVRNEAVQLHELLNRNHRSVDTVLVARDIPTDKHIAIFGVIPGISPTEMYRRVRSLCREHELGLHLEGVHILPADSPGFLRLLEGAQESGIVAGKTRCPVVQTEERVYTEIIILLTDAAP